MEPSTKRTADALGIGMATVKRIMADYNHDPKLLDEPAKMRGRPVHAVSASYQGTVRAYIRSANKKGEYITLANIRGFLKENSTDEPFHIATLARTLNRWGFEFGKGTRSQHLKEKDHVIAGINGVSTIVIMAVVRTNKYVSLLIEFVLRATLASTKENSPKRALNPWPEARHFCSQR